MLFYVETGVKFTNDFGDINEGFYSSMATTYVAALTLMRKENLLDKFADRAGKVFSDTSGIGWGFHDYLCDVHSNFYDDFSDDIDQLTDQQEKSKIIELGGFVTYNMRRLINIISKN
jgi:Fe2+ or Zn2+ uptake regulation protein